jgi:signal transduction histidine kinase
MTVLPCPSSIASLLAEHEREIADEWARVLIDSGGDNYGRLSIAEITWWTTRGLRAVIEYLRTADPGILETHLTQLSKVRRRRGFDIGEVLGGLLTLKEVALPYVLDASRDNPEAAKRLIHDLDVGMRTTVSRFGRLFASDAQHSLQAEKDRIALLLDATKQSGESLDLETIARRVARYVGLALRASWCCVVLRTNEGTPRESRVFACDSAETVFGDALRRAVDLRLGGLRDLAEQRKAPAALDRSSDDPLFREFPQITSVVAIPILLENRVLAHAIGVTTVVEGFDPEQLRVASGVGRTIAPAIAHAELYAESLRNLAESRMLERLSSAILDRIGLANVLELVCREIQSLTGAAGSAVLLEEQGRLEIAFSSGDAATWAYRLLREHVPPSDRGALVEPVLVNELWIGNDTPSSRVRSMLAVPLRVHGDTIGTFQLVNKPPGFDEGDLRIVSRIADQVAMTIEHTRLHAQQEKMAVLEERQRLARDLHDSVTQSIYGVSVLSEATARLLESGETEAGVKNLREMRQAALKALRELRHMIFELRPPELEKLGLVAALRARLTAVEGRAGLKTELEAEDIGDLPLAVADGLYRIAHEAFANSVKHARASKIRLKVERIDDRVVLEILDDGLGFDVDAGRSKGGLGLRGMEERAEKMGGALSIEAYPGQGTLIRVRVPATGTELSLADEDPV